MVTCYGNIFRNAHGETLTKEMENDKLKKRNEWSGTCETTCD